MDVTQKAVEKVISSYGTDFLERKDVFFRILEDMIPEQIEEILFLKKIYTDEIGHILSEALQVHNDKEKTIREIDNYLQEYCGLMEPIRIKFIDIFQVLFRRKTIEVKKFKDYKPALQMLKREFGPDLSNDIVQDFLEENRLFYRFSITADDINHDIKTV